MRTIRASRKLCRVVVKVTTARASDRLFTWFGIHVTKLHIYGGFAGTLSIIDWAEGHLLYSAGVWGLAILDMSKDLTGK